MAVAARRTRARAAHRDVDAQRTRVPGTAHHRRRARFLSRFRQRRARGAAHHRPLLVRSRAVGHRDPRRRRSCIGAPDRAAATCMVAHRPGHLVVPDRGRGTRRRDRSAGRVAPARPDLLAGVARALRRARPRRPRVGPRRGRTRALPRDRPLGRRCPAAWELRGSAGGRERPQHHRTPRRPPDRGGGPRAGPAPRSPSGGDVGRGRHRFVDVPVARCDRGHRRRARHLRAPAGGRCQAVHAQRTARAGAHRAAHRRRGRDRCQLPSREPPDVERVPAEHHRPPRRARHRGTRTLRRQSDRGGGLAAVARGHQRPRAQRAAATPVRIGDQSRVSARPEPHQRAQRLRPGGGGSRPHRVGDLPHAALRGDEGDSQRPAQRARRSTDLRVRARSALVLLVVILVWWNDNALFGAQPETVLAATFLGLLAATPAVVTRVEEPPPVPAVRSRRGSA